MILEQIIASKRKYLAQQTRLSKEELDNYYKLIQAPRDFLKAISRADGQIKVIGEVKKASPSKGILVEDFYPTAIAKGYTRGGVAAISVLTEADYFLGSDAHLQEVRRATQVPILRKDFVIDPYQILEARALGADAVLLIVAALNKNTLREFIDLALAIGLCPLVEVHDRSELEIALELNAPVIGINNRNLHTFQVDLATTFTLLPLIPSDKIVVSESGINSHNISQLQDSRVDAVLIGEALVTNSNTKAGVEQLLS